MNTDIKTDIFNAPNLIPVATEVATFVRCCGKTPTSEMKRLINWIESRRIEQGFIDKCYPFLSEVYVSLRISLDSEYGGRSELGPHIDSSLVLIDKKIREFKELLEQNPDNETVSKIEKSFFMIIGLFYRHKDMYK